MFKKVSVIVPNYNYEKYIAERLYSIINQTYPIFELIVLDDASTDNSVSKIKGILKESKQVKSKLICNSVNSGKVFLQWKKGIEACEGDYFWIAEADDLADPFFLETVMKSFEDPEVLLSYTESSLIDQDGEVTLKTAQGLYNIWQNCDWNHDFVIDGKIAITDYFSVVNILPNVSAVVWKKGDYGDILKCACDYTVAGDWYVYEKILEKGKLAYHKKSLNYFRKHIGSVSKSVNGDKEYREILAIQKDISNRFELTMETFFYQRKRRDFIDKTVTDAVRQKRVAWIIPSPGKGSGGTRTILQNVNALIKSGYDCDIYVRDNGVLTPWLLEKRITEFYGKCGANCYVGFNRELRYDALFITGWQTVADKDKLKYHKLVYFIQDYEPWFFPMGDRYIEIENTYRMPVEGVTIGKWLAYKLNKEFNMNTQYFEFCADLTTYKPLHKNRENAICYIYQPEKDRRCTDIAIEALKLVQKQKPDCKIYLMGSKSSSNCIDGLKVENLGIVSPQTCNDVYNKCVVGLSMSASNPSRVPFEMMAAGLPVVELDRENNHYDLPSQGVYLCKAVPESIANSIIQLLDDENRRNDMSAFGIKYMSKRPLELGFSQFVEAVNGIVLTKQIDLEETGLPIKTNSELEKTEYIGKTLDVTYIPKFSQLKKMIVKGQEYICNLNHKIKRKL